MKPTAAAEPDGSRYKQLIDSSLEDYDEVLNKIDTVNDHKQRRPASR